MKPRDHYVETDEEHGSRLIAAAAVLPDIGVLMQRLPSPMLRRWGAVLHHDERTVNALHRVPVLGAAWKAHYVQDEASHPRGTYRIPEAAGLPPAARMALLYSGGPDAFITWRLLGMPSALYVNVGNAACGEEAQRVQLANQAFEPDRPIQLVLGGSPMSELPTGWIPNRNLRLILAAAQLHPDVVIARIAEWGPDKNPGFFRAVERLLARSRGGHFQAATNVPRVRIHTPFGHLTKTQLVRRYLDAHPATGVADLKDFTWSCYGPGPQFCGECGGCWCRWVAFTNNGIWEDDRYALTPRRLDYYKRLHWADFRPGMVPMYVKRALEMRGMG